MRFQSETSVFIFIRLSDSAAPAVENITGKPIELVKLTYNSGKHENTSQVTSNGVNISEKR